MSTPPISMVPPLGWSMPAIRFSSVLLPEPLGPISATNSPSLHHVEVDVQQHRNRLAAALVGPCSGADADHGAYGRHLALPPPLTFMAVTVASLSLAAPAPPGRRTSARR
jgi:hypothetical protein